MNHQNPSRKPFSRLSTPVRLGVVAVAACFIATPILANPVNPTVVNGSASFNQAGNVLTVTNSNGAIINWDKFSIQSGETTHFAQTSASSTVLNRVLSDPTAIYGTLSSNGRVWLVNPAGILVGPGGRIDTAGFVASTLAIRNEDFLAGRNLFVNDGNAQNVINQGEIRTPSGGSVYLIGSNVSNEGLITTPNGETILAAGATVSLIDSATPGVKVDITGAAGNATNLGSIVADAGRIGIAGVIVRNSGTLNASSVVSEGGRIFLKASQALTLDSASTIRTDAGQDGKGGNVLVWSDEIASIDGSITARGGRQSGDGGFVETSGAHVKIADAARVNTLAPNGKAGTWLIDPNDFTIGVDMTGAAVGSAVDGGNFVIQTTTMGTPGGNGDIFVNQSVTWSSANSLSLLAERNITVSADINGGGAINMMAGGDVIQNTSTMISNGTSAGVHDISFTGANITLRQVQSQRHVLLNASGSVNLLGAGSGGFIDDTYFIYNLPFTFNFFGTDYNQAYITTNGLITFGSSTSAYSDSINGLGSYRAIAPAWNDWTLEASTGRDIRIGLGGGNLTVLWDVGRYSSTAPAARFEAVLNPSGTIRFDYGTAVTLGNDVTIGLSNGAGSGTAIGSQLMSLPGFASTSINNLRSTTFTPNGAGGYIETLSASNTPLAAPGPVSGSAILGQGTGVPVSALGNLVINAGGQIYAPSDLIAQTLQFVSHGGASLTGSNQFGAITASHNYTSGDVTIYNSTAPGTLTVNGLANDGGNLALDNVGGIVVTGAMSASGNLDMVAHSPITIDSGASVTAGGNLTLVAFASSVSSTTDLLTIAGALSSTGGNVALTGGSGIGFEPTASVAAPFGSVAAASPYGPVTVAPGAQLSAAFGITLTSYGATNPVPVEPTGLPFAPDSQITQGLLAGLDGTDQFGPSIIDLPHLGKEDKEALEGFGMEEGADGKKKSRKVQQCAI